jgi:putative tricarboxylic transport membrane protein
MRRVFRFTTDFIPPYHMSAPNETHAPADGNDTAITRRTAEIAVGILIAVMAAVVIVSNYQLGAGWASDGPEAGYFPLRMGVVIFLCSLFVIVQAWKKKDSTPFVEKAQLRLVATVLLPLVAYVIVLQLTGIYVASAIFVAAFMLFVGKFSWWKSAAVGLGMSAALFWIFEIMFQVPLPKGPLEALFGY